MIIHTLILAFLTALFLLLILGLMGYFIYSRIERNKEKKYRKTGKEKRVIIENKSLQEDQAKSILSDENTMLFEDFKDTLEDLINDSTINEVILDVDNMSLSPNQVEEVRPIFEAMSRCKNVISIGTLLVKENYLIALLAPKIYLLDTNNSGLMLKSYGYSDLYKKPLLDKLGIKLTPIHIGDYKVAGEAYGQDHMSEARRESLYNTGDHQEELFIDLVKEKRGIDIKEDLINGKLLMVNRREAKEYGLIDGYISYEELGMDNKEESISLKKYRHIKLRNKNIKFRDKSHNIAVLTLEGNIMPFSSDDSYISYKNVKNKVDQLEKYKNLEGVVLRINSRGGSALEAEKIYRLIEKIDLPIYVSMGDYCASGGYYIACAGDKLFANKNTLTGSIGVVSLYPEFDQALDKIGLNNEMVTRGKGQDLYNPLMFLSDQSKELIVKNMEEVYQEFKERVSQSRNITDQQLEPLAGGRVYLGKQALDVNLIDEIASLDESIQALINDQKIKDPKIVHIREILSIEELKERLKNKYKFISIEEKIKNLQAISYQPLFLEDNIL